jgi:restriction endonuclease-like protein
MPGDSSGRNWSLFGATSSKQVVLGYRDFSQVFDLEQLAQTGDHYLSYQLLRNVLAAYALRCSFCLLVDARRPDLVDAWYAGTRCVKPVEFRTELGISTWQEVARAAPRTLRAFLAAKLESVVIASNNHLRLRRLRVFVGKQDSALEFYGITLVIFQERLGWIPIQRQPNKRNRRYE